MNIIAHESDSFVINLTFYFRPRRCTVQIKVLLLLDRSSLIMCQKLAVQEVEGWGSFHQVSVKNGEEFISQLSQY